MKTKYIVFSLLLAVCAFFVSCEDKLDIEQHGVSTMDGFYETDDEAEEAIIAVYDAWKSRFFDCFWVKNLLSDDCYGSSESWTGGSCYLLTEYTFDTDYSNIEDLYEDSYSVIYAANVVLENVDESSDVKLRARAEARVFRAMAYIDLISLWGTPPLVDHTLTSDEYSQPNGDPSELWAFVESDLTTAINSGDLEEKSDVDTYTYRITKQFAQALLGKAYVYQEEWSSAASMLEEVINSGKYALYEDFSNILTTKGEANCESLFEINYVYDANNLSDMANFLWVYTHWRADMLDFQEPEQIYNHGGWGFFNPSKDAYDAFVEMGDTYRLAGSIATYEEMQAQGISMLTSVTYMCDNAGFFDWKYRIYEEDIITNWYVRCPNNSREMRYADVLLLAAEANLQSGNSSKALDYINQVRTRAQLPSLSSVSMDDIKKERRLELWLEGSRYQDLVRWGDAASVLADRGKARPCLYPDGTVSWTVQTNSSAGFVSGKHELLPFPVTEMNVNPNMVQNPGY